jgi:23S rRNA (adenine2503-C2)-methyltransferase
MWNDIQRIDDTAQNVAKFVFRKDDAVAEAVLYKYPDYKTRTVICCSTQAGCRFCGAGDYFARSLTAEESISQPGHLLSLVDCRPEEMGRLQMMFMSMGEPLLNLMQLIPALRGLYSRHSNAALLISTSGPQISGRQWSDLV